MVFKTMWIFSKCDFLCHLLVTNPATSVTKFIGFSQKSNAYMEDVESFSGLSLFVFSPKVFQYSSSCNTELRSSDNHERKKLH